MNQLFLAFTTFIYTVYYNIELTCNVSLLDLLGETTGCAALLDMGPLGALEVCCVTS